MYYLLDASMLTDNLASTEQLDVDPKQVGRVIGSELSYLVLRQGAEVTAGQLHAVDVEPFKREVIGRPVQPVANVIGRPQHRIYAQWQRRGQRTWSQAEVRFN